MMILLFPVGAALLALALADIIYTTLSMRGAGPLAASLMKATWQALIKLHRIRRGPHKLLERAGTLIIVSMVLVWVLLLWMGWSLIFLSVPHSVVDATTLEPAGGWSVVYYAGFNLFTLGLGDFKPSSPLWQMLTVLCAANGLLILTLSATYLVPIVSAAAAKRQLAALISTLGGTPAGILQCHWNGRDFSALEGPLAGISQMILLQSQQYLAYPALNFFHSTDAHTSLTLRVAALDEALTLLSQALPAGCGVSDPAMHQARSAIGMFLETAGARPSRSPPPAPDIGPLAEASFPIARNRLEESLAEVSERRRILRDLVEKDGWSWDEVGAPPRLSP